MPTIHLLPDQLVSQIAAGEVVERPASVVKELLENSIDAGADQIEIELEAGGKRGIKVLDDGCGMERDDALLAFDRHATSKIDSFEDLQEVETLGFRGEALSSIAAVARIELRSAREPGSGTLVRIDGGRVRGAEAITHPQGTSVEVRSLFFNVPARRKFLKTSRTELRRATEVTQGYALARPEVRFAMLHEGRTLLETLQTTPGAAGARLRVGHIFGEKFAEQLSEMPAMELPGGGTVWGLLGNRSTARRRRLFTFVNRRLLRDRAILATFYRAVREEWRSEDFPALFLFIDVPPQQVDVNVHPQKSEVRFRDPSLLDGVQAILRRGLQLARGEEPAFFERPEASFTAPLAWQGVGDSSQHSDFRAGSAGSLVEDSALDPSTARLAEATYAPIERAPVPLTGRSGQVRSFRLLGQYKGTLLLLEGPDGLYVIDQHVAHERILYERFRRDLENQETPAQTLLEPILLELGTAEAMRLAELRDELEGCGFSLREMSGSTIALQAVPAVLKGDDAEKLLVQLTTQDNDQEEGSSALRRRLLDSLAASQSCRAAVKMHHPLSADEMERLVAELFATEQPFACPHGRPIILKMSDTELEKRFGRR